MLPGLSPIIEVADKLSAIQAVKGKLIQHPDPASDKLVTALEEVSKIYSSMEQELVKYLSLSFDPSEPPNKERAFLLAIAGGEIAREMAKARGSCGKIVFIYYTYLAPWFSGVLNHTESDLMQEVFRSLDELDGQMVHAIDGVAKWVEQEASAVLSFVDSGDLVEAKKRIIAGNRDVLPSRQAISRALCSLLDLQAEFIAISPTI